MSNVYDELFPQSTQDVSNTYDETFAPQTLATSYDEFNTTQAPLPPVELTEEERKAYTPISTSEKLANLEKRKAQILAKHTSQDQFASLSDSYTVLENGVLESNRNKLWDARDMSGAQFNSLFNVLDEVELTTDDQGQHYLPSGEIYQGPVRRVYGYGTKDSDTAFKFGVARGDRDSSDTRYTDYETGLSGVDINKKHSDKLYPSYIANAIESIGHSRQEALEGRFVPNILDKEQYDKYGSGGSEYYKSKEAFFGDPTSENYGTPYTPEEAKEVLYNYASLFSDPYYKGQYSDQTYLDAYYARLSEQAAQDRFDNQTLLDDVTQGLPAIPASMAKGFLDLVDAGQEALTYIPQLGARIATGDSTYDIDLFDDTFKQTIIQFTDELVGYDRKMDDILMQRVISDIQAADVDITSWESIKSAITDPEKRSKLGSAAITALTDPSFTAAMMAEIFGSGLGLGTSFKVGAKILSKAAPAAEKLITNALRTNLATLKVDLAAATAAKDVNKIAELKKSYDYTKKIPDFIRGTTYTNADMMVRMNNDITAFKEYNNGEDPSPVKLLQIAILDRVASQMEVMSLKSLVGIEDIPPIVAKAAVKKGIIKAAGHTAAHLAKDGLMEGAQESFDTIVEQFNQKIDTADFKDKSIPEIISLASSEILAGTIAGAAGGIHAGGTHAGASALGTTLLKTREGIGNLNQKIKEKRKVELTKTSLDTIDVPTKEEDVKTAKDQYSTLLRRVNNEVLQGKVTQANLGTYLDDIDEINRSRHLVADSSPEGKKNEEAVYNTIVTHLEKLVNENQDAPLTKRIVRKTVQESAQDKADKEFAGLPTEVVDAFQTWDSVGQTEPRNISKAIQDTVDEIKKADTIEDIINDPEVLSSAVQQLEQSLTGEVSGDITTSFANVKTYLADNDVKSKIDPNFVAEQATGSTVVEEEQEYTDYTRAVDAERAITTLLGSSRTYDDTFIQKMAKFAKNSNISDKKFQDLVKSYESVDEEAVRGPRGFKTRLARLKGLIESTAPKDNAITDELNSLIRMQSNFATAVTQLEGGITGANREAAELNRQQVTPKEKYRTTTEYLKEDGTKFDIDIIKKGDKWVALTEEAQKRANIKKQYAKEIQSELRIISSRAATVKPGTLPNLGTFVTPTRKKSTQGKRPIKSAGFFKNIGDTLSNIGVGAQITKVIVGEKPTADFAADGAYRTANSILVNNNDYEADDVVLISDNSFIESKSGKNFGHKLFSGKDADLEKLTEPQKLLRAALDAGVAFVLDPDMDERAKAGLKQRLIHNHGYIALDGYTGSVLVKGTAENKAILKAEKEKLAAETKDKTAKKALKESLIAAELSLKYNVDQKTGITLDAIEVKELKQKIKQLSDTTLNDIFDGDTGKLARFVENRIKKDVKELATEQLTAGEDATPLNVPGNKGLEEGAKQYIAAELDRMSASQQVLADWKNVVEEEQLRGKERDSAIKKLLASIGAVPRILAEMVKEHSFAVGKNDIFEERYMVLGKNGKPNYEVTAVARKERSPEEIQRLRTEGEVRYRSKDKYILLDVRRVVQNPFKLINLTKTTVLNSMATAQLPFGIQDNVEKFQKVIFKALRKVEPAETDEQTDIKIDGTNKFKDGSFNLYNSPARGFIFNKDGKPNEQVLAAMYVALADMMKTDLGKLMRGYKSDADIALMFGIQEYEVTREMRQHAKDHGTFFKTVANSLGKGVLQQLGFTKTNVSATGEYEALVADLGNSLIAIGEQAGLLKITSEKSNKIAQWFSEGKVLDAEADTYFVHVTDQDEKVGKYNKKVPTEVITKFIKTFDEVVAEFPESSTTRVEYTFRKPSEEQLEKATTTVRNDLFMRVVPKAAQTTLKTLMNTGYEANLERITEFLDAVDAIGSKVKKHLGYIEIGSPEYDKLYTGDKEVQEAKNRAINKTIEELRLLKDRLERYQNEGKPIPELFFEYFYASNDRYMLLSTLNPQVDKIVRFLVVPSAHRLNYTITVNGKGGLLFDVDGEDQSYMVRLALSQAFGQGVDKMRAADVIQFGDALLGLTDKQLDVIKAQLLANNEHVIQIAGTTTQLKLKADHITHTLQAIDFLKQVKTGSVNSSLSLEFDSLTSGFANKIQQMPILADMDKHFARVGIFTENFQRELREKFSREFKPATGDSVATILADGKDIGFYDSYQSLAIKVTDILSGNDPAVGVFDNLSTSSTGKGRSGVRVYEAIKSLLPGSDIVDSKQNYRGEENQVIDIDKTLRDLFKPPFMIFNYSAGINRITKNLGFEVSDDIAGRIAKANFADDVELKDIVTEVIKSAGELHYKEKDSTVEKSIKTAEELQKVLREYHLNQVKIKNPFPVKPNQKPNTYPKNLGDLFVDVVTLTYGEAVKQVFESEFEAFINVQDAMNDTYKIAFRIFDHKRMEKLSTLRLEKENKILTAEDHAQVLEELWDDFPWIVGPLTGADNKSSVQKDVITIASTAVKSPSEIERARVNPQIWLGTGFDNDQRGVTPLIRYMEEAVSSGSVLPFHAIDGAEIGYLINSLGVEGVAAIHDAVLTPINESDRATFLYQEGMQKINAGEDGDVGYSLSKALGGLIERVEKTLTDEKFAKTFKDVKVKGLKLAETDKQGKVTENFPQAATRIVAKMKAELRNIDTKRAEYYGPNGKLTGAYYGNMVGSPASMFKVGMTGPDLSYKEAFSGSYGLPAILENVINEDTEKVAEINQTAEQQTVNEIDAANKDMERKGCRLL